MQEIPIKISDFPASQTQWEVVGGWSSSADPQDFVPILRTTSREGCIKGLSSPQMRRPWKALALLLNLHDHEERNGRNPYSLAWQNKFGCFLYLVPSLAKSIHAHMGRLTPTKEVLSPCPWLRIILVIQTIIKRPSMRSPSILPRGPSTTSTSRYYRIREEGMKPACPCS